MWSFKEGSWSAWEGEKVGNRGSIVEGGELAEKKVVAGDVGHEQEYVVVELACSKERECVW